MRYAALVAAAFAFLGNVALAAENSAAGVAGRACAAISTRVDAYSAAGPLLLRSYDGERGDGAADEPALRTAAFTYDNALAVIGLLACGKPAQAARIGDALRLAAMGDARLRKYLELPPYIGDGVAHDKPLTNGWWEAKENRWIEDAYQDGTAAGNVAWTALAMLALFDATQDLRWREAALHLGKWLSENTADSRGAGGFSGGIDGFDANPKKLGWKSTEQNIDLAAMFTWLSQLQPSAEWAARANSARSFVRSQWNAQDGFFFVGTLPDGATPNRATSGLDVQMWAQLLPDAPHEWRSAVAYAEREHAVAGGFDFNTDRDGLWLEGTAQAALVYRKLAREADAQKLFATIMAQFSRGGLLYATREPRITTGLAVNQDSASADFYYYRRPHLGATAWAALAALGRNPFAAQ